MSARGLLMRAARRAFSALVAVWPSRLVRLRRDEIDDLFARLATDAYQKGGARALASTWLRSVADLVFGSPWSAGFRRARAHRAGAVSRPVRPHLFDDLRQDFRHARRSLARTPGFTAAAVLLLALGIGASTVIYSVFQAVLLRPLPYPDPDRLMAVWSTPEGDRTFQPISAPDYYDWRERNRSFAELGVQSADWVNLSGAGRPERVQASTCTASFLRAVGVTPARGRLFADDEEASRARVVVIADGLRRRWFGDDPDVVGRQLLVNREPHRVIGVMPSGFEGPRPSPSSPTAEIWLPLPPESRVRVTGGWRRLYALGRLAPGVSRKVAEQDLATIAADLARQYPDTNARLTAWVQPFFDREVGSVRRPLWFLLAAVVLLLLIACANVAGMLLERTSACQAELAVRASLGAGRGRLVRQVLTESVLLAAVGGVVGVLLAWWGIEALRAVMPRTIPRAAGVRIDRLVLVCSTGAVLATGVVSGVASALSASRLDVMGVLRLGHRVQAGGRRRACFRHALVVGQFALALLLAHGGVLMLRSYLNVLGTPAGVDTDHTLVVGLTLRGERYDANEETQAAYWTRLLHDIEAIPGVRVAGVTSKLPFEGGTNGSLLVDSEQYEPEVRRPVVEKSFVSPGYFAAMGLPLVAGRLPAPVRPSDRVFDLVVNQAFVDRYWPGQHALGRTVRSNSPELNWSGTIVGVVGNARQWGLEQAPLPEIYYPMEVSSGATRNLVVGAAEPRMLARPVLDAVASVDPDQPVSAVRTMGDVFTGGASARRFQTLLVQLFALAALAMVLAGVYAATSYHVTAGVREIGIRMALGAGRTSVVTAVVGRGLSLGALGAALGAIVSLGSSGLIASLLFGIDPRDPITLVVAGLMVIVVASAGSALPALRAASIDPSTVLRTA